MGHDKNAMSLERHEKTRMILKSGEILGPLSGLGRSFEIRGALTLEARPTS